MYESGAAATGGPGGPWPPSYLLDNEEKKVRQNKEVRQNKKSKTK